MPVTKIGASQIDKPAPLWYRRLSNALIIFILPGVVTLVQSWGLSDKVANHWLTFLSFAPALVKGIGVVLGNGQVYSPTNQAVDNAQPTEPPAPSNN
jgi:hypothetical protein